MNIDYVTLTELILFKPENEREKEIFNINKDIIIDMMIKLNDNMYYLGGLIKMTFDDKLDIGIINKVRDIEKKRLDKYGGPCNSLEAMSINNHRIMLDETEKILKKYFEVMKLRKDNIY
jgi:hypothetical protein